MQIVPEVDLRSSIKEPLKHAGLVLMKGSTNQSVLTIAIHMVDGSEAMLKQSLDVLDGPDIVQEAVVQLPVTVLKCEANRVTLG
jgi:hypothetical protein